MALTFDKQAGVFAILLFATAAAVVRPKTTDIFPENYSFGNSSTAYNFSSSACITLTSSNPSVTLDYGIEIGGFPFVNVSDISEPGVQIETKYSEAKASLDFPQADGPWTYSNGLSNTFRVETFEISSTGREQSFFIQGGQRWQAIKLLGEGNLTFCGVGFASSNDVRLPKDLPGYFESSNEIYNKIWALGVRSTQQSCIAKGTAPSTWEITDDGAFIRGQAPAQSALGTAFSNYTLTFSTKIARGGVGWRAAAGLKGYGPYFVLTSEYPEGTFLNTNRTLLPPNTLIANFGWSLVNQTTLITGPNAQYTVPFDVKEGVWYKISTAINATGYTISIDGQGSIFVSNGLAAADWESNHASSGDKMKGTWGFGPFQDQEAYFTNVTVKAANGTVIYQNDLTDKSTLEEYGVSDNTHNVCLDGAKRDRLVWTGDYSHTQRIIGASTNNSDFSTGTLSYAFQWQDPPGSSFAGFSGMSAAMGASPNYGTDSAGYNLIDYQFLYITAIADYYQYSGDYSFLSRYWTQLETLVEALLLLVDPGSGLVTTGPYSGYFFLGLPNGTAPSAAFIFALEKAASLALAVGDNSTASSWGIAASDIKNAINTQLWNEEIGTYVQSTDNFESFSLNDIAFAILSGVAPPERAIAAITALDNLRLGIGYKSTSTVTTAANETSLSPNYLGFVLEALLKTSEDFAFSSANTTNATIKTTPQIANAVSVLFDQFWPAMVTNDLYATGSAWEYVYGDGRPGLDAYTSHAHPWGGAPTYVLSEYVLGVRATSPGYKTWEFVPSIAVTNDVNVEWVKGRMPAPGGGIEAEWRREKDDEVRISVCGIEGTIGVIRVPGKEKVVVDGDSCVDKVL